VLPTAGLKPDLVTDSTDKEDESNFTDVTQSYELHEYRAIIQKAAKMLKGGPFNLSGLVPRPQPGEKIHSPPRRPFTHSSQIPGCLLEHQTTRSRTRSQTRKRKNAEPMSAEPTIRIIKPRVLYSNPFKLGNMMQGLSLAIACGLVSISEKKNKVITSWPEQGKLVKGLHPVVEEDGLQWAKVDNMNINYMTCPLRNPGEEKYILLRETGYGRNGRVVLAVDAYGNACALKFYLLNVETETNFSAKNMVQAEKERWETLQKSYVDGGHVEALILNRQNVLRMPLCAPVPVELRLAVLADVKQKLLDFYEKGFTYSEIRWNHIGCRHKKAALPNTSHSLEIIMLGLESLEQKAAQPGVIDEQIAELARLAQTAAPASPTSGLLTY